MKLIKCKSCIKLFVLVLFVFSNVSISTAVNRDEVLEKVVVNDNNIKFKYNKHIDKYENVVFSTSINRDEVLEKVVVDNGDSVKDNKNINKYSNIGVSSGLKNGGFVNKDDVSGVFNADVDGKKVFTSDVIGGLYVVADNKVSANNIVVKNGKNKENVIKINNTKNTENDKIALNVKSSENSKNGTIKENEIDNINNKINKFDEYEEYDKYDDFDEYDYLNDFDEYDDYYTEAEITIISDPLEKINRKVFTFNIFVLNNIGEPLMKFYNKITNQFIRDCLSNFGDRFFDPLTLINSILQLDYKNSFKTIATFTTNMTIGVFGLFNPAEHFGFYREKRTFGQTLAYYGVENGFYLMLPFFGPSTLRESAGILLGVAVDPFSFNFLGFDGDVGDLTPNELLVPKYIGGYSGKVDSAVKLNKQFLEKSFDPYIFARDSYIQNLHYKNINLKNNNEVENEK